MLSVSSYKTKQKMDIFLGKLCSDMPKKADKFVRDMVYGISAQGSVMLSDIVRALDEDTAPIHTEKRLSRNLLRENLADELCESLLKLSSSHIHKDSLLILDPSDITKNHAKKMDYLDTVRDGSTGGYADGYHLIQVIGANTDDSKFIPLYSDLYSCKHEEFDSENQEILRAIDKISTAVNGNGIWVIDRGGDRRKLLKPLLSRGNRFIIRSTGVRHCLYNRQKLSIRDIADKCKIKYANHLVKQDGNKEKITRLDFGYVPITLPDTGDKLSLVVIKGFGHELMMLLTNLPLTHSRKAIWNIVQSYIARWRIEESIRFIKQAYDLENIRVLRWQRLKNMIAIVNIVAYFTATYLDISLKSKILAEHLLQHSKRIFSVPNMRLYALADAIRLLFMRYPAKKPKKPPDNNQMKLQL